jgi:hypothetical protein
MTGLVDESVLVMVQTVDLGSNTMTDANSLNLIKPYF